MNEWAELFKTSPIGAIGAGIAAGAVYLWKNWQEKSVDNREVSRLMTALDAVIKERDEERDRADEAFKKQLELTERFSEMRAQSERLLERMESMDNHMKMVVQENENLRKQIAALNDLVRQLQTSINVGNIQ